MTLRKCQLCSQLFSQLRQLVHRFFGGQVDCQGINHRTNDEGDKRVSKINAAAPSCACEKYRMSRHSPGVIENSELLALFVFLPMHNIDKSGKAKPNIFSHVHRKGRSIQRDSVAQPNELIRFASDFLADDEGRVWKGVLLAKCEDVRNIKSDDSLNRAVCIYDSAEKENPAHGEMAQTQHVIEADEIELRHDLLAVFGGGAITTPLQYRDGFVWNSLSPQLQARN
ncbi:MAG: hypothetical protein PHQ60_03175 [Sideroxydans sp.]|nr:hypothetical protein [Sideroxydans sp.]